MAGDKPQLQTSFRFLGQKMSEKKLNILRKLPTSNITWAILGESPDPPTPYPPRPL